MRYFLVAALVLLFAVNASAAGFTRTAARADAGAHPYGLSQDCLLQVYNTCSGWIWTWTAPQGAVFGSVFDPMSCAGGCANGGAVSDLYLYGRCSAPPGHFNGIDVESVDGVGCPTALLYHSGPVTITHCVAGDRWTHFTLPLVHVFGNPFALTVEWGSDATNPTFSTENGIGNLYCSMGYIGFPGCATTAQNCTGWVMGPQVTYIYITDINGDTVLDDLCALYGVPYAMSFPYVYGFGYLTNNLVLSVGLDCQSPTAVEPTSWGHVKAMYE